MIANALLLFGGIACVLIVIYVWQKDKIDAWWARVRSTKGGQQAIADINRVEGALLDRLRKKESPGVQPPVTAGEPQKPTGASLAATPAPAAAPLTHEEVEAFLRLERRAAAAPVAPAAAAIPTVTKEATMATIEQDKGVVTAGELLAGWVLPDPYANPPVPGTLARRHADLMYLLQMSKKPGGNNVLADVVIGPTGTVPNYAHHSGMDAYVDWAPDGTHKDWSTDPNVTPAIKRAAEDSVKVTLAGWAARGVNVPTHDFSRYYRPTGTPTP